MATLSTQDAKRFYDRFGAKQDQQVWYEAPALDDLVEHADLAAARSVFELGCGTGRLAAEILDRDLPASATYRGVDLSDTMVGLASRRLSRFADRASVTLTAGEPTLPLPEGSVDRFLSTYVLDLLPPEGIRGILSEAHRVLAPDGLLCLAGITPGTTTLARVLMTLWRWVHSVRPAIVGGCRPIRLVEYVASAEWAVRHHRVVATRGIASEVLVAAPAHGASSPSPDP
jgi:ubiquinone/menaquinone biosynthesis C-methylase UbiE